MLFLICSKERNTKKGIIEYKKTFLLEKAKSSSEKQNAGQDPAPAVAAQG